MSLFKNKKNIKTILIVIVLAIITTAPFFIQMNEALVVDDHKQLESVIYKDTYDLSLTTEEKSWLKANPAIHLGIDRAFPPFGTITKDREYIGFTADIMQIISYRLGSTFLIEKDASWSETMKMAKTGQIDMIAALVDTPERQSFLTFSPAFIKTPTIIINDGAKNGYIGSLEKLKGKHVAVEKGSYAAGEIKRKYPQIKLSPVENTSMALSLVAIGKADAYVGNAVTSSYIIRKLAYHNLSFSGETEYSSDHSIGIIKKNKQLSNIVNKALKSISKNDLDTITNYWFGMRVQPFIAKDTLLVIAIIFGGIILFFGGWILSLRQKSNNLITNQETLQHQSEIDYLTGLGNRRKFNSHLEKIIQLNHSRQKPFSLFFLDLDLFKEVNDSLGHAIGDLLLVLASKRISTCVREYDGFVARVGGDEFIIILSEIESKNTLDEIVGCILSSLNQPFFIEGNEILITASIGITRFPQDADNAKQLIINSDQAMYHSKKIGRNCYSYFDKFMFTENQYKASLIRDLRTATNEEKFKLHYQPIIDFSNNKITKAEALIRWNHPERGFVSPAEFIPLAEESGQINTIGDWTFKEAIDDTVLICNEHYHDFQMTINTSPLQYRKNGMDVPFWCKYMDARGLSGKNIVVEITEGILMESSQSVINNLFKLRDQNINIAIDDFGTGYSSLSYLKKFDVDFLKIDQSFIKNMTTEPNDIALVQAIIVMAHQLGIKVIAEGIETEEQRNILVDAGCDYGQGFYFSKALELKDLLVFLDDWKNKSTTKIDQVQLGSISTT